MLYYTFTIVNAQDMINTPFIINLYQENQLFFYHWSILADCFKYVSLHFLIYSTTLS